MTKAQFDLYVTALLKSIWQGEEQAPDCLGVKVEEVYGGQLKNHLDKVHAALGENVPLNKGKSSILSPFSYLCKNPEIQIPIGELSLKQKFLFGGKNGKTISEQITLLENHLENLPNPGTQPKNFFKAGEMLLSLLQYYCSTLPTGGTGASLYDLARLTTAMTIGAAIGEEETQEYLFIKADLSGIQDFIFDVISKGAAKSLKSRSLRVQILSFLQIDYLLRELELSPANTLFNGGGNYFLVAPASNQKDRLKKLRDNLLKKSIEVDPAYRLSSY